MRVPAILSGPRKERFVARVSRLLLPASAQRFIELDQASIFVPAGRCERQFRRIKRALSVEHLEVCRRAALVAKRGDANGFLQVGYRILLACPDLDGAFRNR